MVRQLRERAELPNFSERLSYNGKAVDSHSTGRVGSKTGERPRRPGTVVRWPIPYTSPTTEIVANPLRFGVNGCIIPSPVIEKCA